MKYSLEKYKSRTSKHLCPGCGKKTFVMYVNEEGDYFSSDIGRCDRESKCGYHQQPEGLNFEYIKPVYIPVIPTFLPDHFIDKYLKNSHVCNFERFLISKFGERRTGIAISKYHIGAWGENTVFPQIDKDFNFRTGKIMIYDVLTGKRQGNINWLHRQVEGFSLQQVFFGEHLIDGVNKINIVESEKTAIIMSIIEPTQTWLATGGLGNLNFRNIKRLGNRIVILHPDASLPNKKGETAYQIWEEKTKDLGCSMSDFIERNTNKDQKYNGYDLADYILDHPKYEL